MGSRKASRVDANQAEIVRALRDVGATVQHLHTVGGGCPDLLVGFRGRTYLMEIKTTLGTLTEAEGDWFADWTGGEASVVRSVSDALRMIGYRG